MSLVIVKSSFGFKNDTAVGNIHGSCWWFVLAYILVTQSILFLSLGGVIFSVPLVPEVYVSMCECVYVFPS